ncbi:1-phosphofructokinase family hexose kinase [Acidihalobacter ferrooxydans]|uniref:Phosphofructokinase n=1 Tax=Acidihalobacter ferrooxydans TaxID=1765967 RepID=A0A1P8UIL6_9GAMM|nr:1-phosphofructokinase family hexose kinase [Acidihalobacter ferrooxydans]APZ43685.1 carbohydrate kinase [Acidihalobacter ferrooxydans]
MTHEPLPPVVTLTLNPCVDVSYDIAHLIEDQKVHATANRYDPGGNGINVARALKRLHVPAHACCVVAGEIGQLFERLVAHELDHPHCLRIEGETRVNVTIQQSEPRAQFEVSGLGPPLSALARQELVDEVLGLTGGGYAVLTGSLCPSVDAGFYAELAQQLRLQAAHPVIDTQGAALAQVIDARPFLIKPNRYEVEQLVGRALPELVDVAKAACELQSRGIDYVCVSLGGAGALLADGEHTYHARAPEVAVASTVGAGDSMLAGLLTALARSEGPAEALRLGLACGSGTAMQPGTELFEYNQMQTLLGRVDVVRVDHCMHA